MHGWDGMDEWMDGCHGWLGWMDGWMDGWTGWMEDGWDGLMDGRDGGNRCMDVYFFHFPFYVFSVFLLDIHLR